MSITELARLAGLLRRARPFAEVARRATSGDPVALANLRGHWQEAADLAGELAGYPGAGALAQQIAGDIRSFLYGNGPTVVDGTWREITADAVPPYASFVDRLSRSRSGGHIILGAPGTGKTSLANRLAERWMTTLDYQVEVVAMYGRDRPAFATTITTQTLIHRMRKLRRYLDAQAVPDADEMPVAASREDADGESAAPAPEPALPPRRRVVIIDEASLSLSSRQSNPETAAAVAALMHCRHLDWHVVYVAQMARLLPEGLFAQTTQWVKRPLGKEKDADRDNPIVQDLWERAEEAFAPLRQSPWFAPPYATIEAWTYVDSLALHFRGLVPAAQPSGVPIIADEDEAENT